jgi:hypothetical protein
MIIRTIIIVILVQLAEGWIMEWLLPLTMYGRGY